MIIIVYLVILAAAFFLLIVLPQRRRMAAHQRLMAGLAVGDEIVTAGGFHGTVRTLGDATIDVEIAPGVVVAVARGAIAARVEVPPPGPAPSDTAPFEAGDEEDGTA